MSKENEKRSGIRRILDTEMSDLVQIGDPARFGAVYQILLGLWALLPALAALGYLWSWVHNGGMRSQEWGGNRHVYYGILYYSRIYFVLGAVTLLAVVAHLLVFQRSTDHLRRAARSEPWNVLLLALLLWAVPGTLLSADPWAQATGSTFQFDGLVSYFLWAGIYLCALLCPTGDRLLILRVFTGITNICVLLMVGQLHAWPIIHDAFFRTSTAVFVHRNHLAYYLCTSAAVSAGLLLYDRGRGRGLWYALSYTFQVYGLLQSDTFGSYIALAATLPILLLFFHRSGRRLDRLAVFPVAVLLILTLLFCLDKGPFQVSYQEDISFTHNFGDLWEGLFGLTTGDETVFEGNNGGSGRLRLWRSTIGFIPQHPILGFGPNGSPPDLSPNVGDTRPHNAFLQIALFHGIPGLILYAAALICLLIRQWGRLKDLDPSALIAAGGVTCYLASSFFGVPMFYTTSYLFLLLGFAAGRVPGDPLGEDTPPPKDAADTGKAVHWGRLAVLLAVVLAAAGVVWDLLGVRVEQEREREDVAYMRLANYCGRDQALSSGALSDGVLPDGAVSIIVSSDGALDPSSDGETSWPLVFWLEPEEGVLTEDPVPAYGAGTARRGRQMLPEEELAGLDGMSYDTAEDHRGQALRVTVGPEVGSDGYLVEWVPVDDQD